MYYKLTEKEAKDELGFSIKTTPIKQKHFETVISTHLKIVSNIIKKHDWVNPCYIYFDLNSGPGKVKIEDLVIYGSPTIMLHYQINFYLNQPKQKIEFINFFLEIKAKYYESLKIITKEIFYTFPIKENKIKTTIKNIDFEKFFKHRQDHIIKHSFSNFDNKKATFGLLYHDPRGVPSFNLLTQISKEKILKFIDILINCPCGTIKRTSRCKITKNKGNNLTLLDGLNNINKKHWLIKRPYENHEWSFLLGTNWADFPQFEKIGMYRLDSPEGKEIFERLNYTTKEREQINEFRINRNQNTI